MKNYGYQSKKNNAEKYVVRCVVQIDKTLIKNDIFM